MLSKKFDNYMVLANHFLDQYQYHQALDGYEKSLAFAPDEEERKEVLLEIADIHLYLHQYEEAQGVFETLKAQDEKMPEVYYGLAIINDFTKGPLERSKDYYKKAIELDPSYDRAHYYLGHVLWDLGDEKLAEEEFKTCTQLDPNDPITYNDLGALYESWGQLDKAKENIEKSLVLDPNYWRALFNMGVVLKGMGEHKEALSFYRKSLEEKPMPDTFLNMSAIYIEDQNFLQALEILQEGLGYFPNAVNLRYNTACTFVHLNKDDDGWLELEKAIAENPNVIDWAYKDPDLTDLMLRYHKGGNDGNHKDATRN